MLKEGQHVRIHYAGTLETGVDFVNTWLTGGPIEVVIGENEFLPRFNQALRRLGRGERTKLRIPAEEAYGSYDPEAVVTVPRAQIPDNEALKEGAYVFMSTSAGVAKVKVKRLSSKWVTLDCNHELAGHDLTFEIELVADGEETLVERERMGTGCGCGCDKLKEALSGDECCHGHRH